MDKQNIRRRFPVDNSASAAMADTMDDKNFDRSTIPIIYRSSSTIQHMTVYMNFLNLNYFYNLSDPTQFGLKCAKSFRIQSDNGIVLGAWHILPNEEQCSKQKLTNAFNDDKLVFLYSHGNSGTRSSNHRVSLLKLLSNQLDVHVVTFDYRSYGDSTDVLATPNGLANDTRYVYQWLLEQNISPKRIVVWGHSLGTAVTVLLLSKLPYEIYPIAGILEAPFTSIYEATATYPLTKIYRALPYFKYFFLDPLSQNEQTNFNSSALLYSIRCPLLIMHAEDDAILPIEIGEKLYKQAKELQPKNVAHLTKFVSFPYENGYGHKKIFSDPKLIDIVKEFIVSIKFNNNNSFK